MKLLIYTCLILICFLCSSTLATYFFIDPDYNGSIRNGSTEKPWKYLNESWTAINSALDLDDVTVYISARESYADIDENYGQGGSIYTKYTTIQRTPNDERPTWLTIDGYSKWNTDDNSPNWQNYSGKSKALFYGSGSETTNGEGIAWWNQNGFQNRLRIKGLKLLNGRVAMHGGNYIELIDNVFVQGAYLEYAHYHLTGHSTNGGCHDILIKGNEISNPLGECLYIGGGGDTNLGGHYNVTIEGNIIHGCGTFSGEGDGIDTKDELVNLVVRGNTIYDCNNNAVVSSSPGLFENNICYNAKSAGFQIGTGWGPEWTADTIIRNNLTYDNNINIYFAANTTEYKHGIYIYNNTLYNSLNPARGNMTLGATLPIASAEIKNNIIYKTASGTDIQGWGYSKIQHRDINNNLQAQNPVFVDENLFNFNLQPTSPGINKGADLSPQGFNTDILGTTRPQGNGWDIGAYEFVENTPPINPICSNPERFDSIEALNVEISKWFSGELTLQELLIKIKIWKYCN